MKKFLISMLISIICITIGFTTLLFEFHTYEIVDAPQSITSSSMTLRVKDIMHDDEINVRMKDSYIYAEIRDDLSDSDEIVITYPNHIDVDVKSNRIDLSYNEYSHHSYSYRGFRDAFDTFVGGLKEKKLYINYEGIHNRVVIHCSPELRDQIYRSNYD